MYALKPPTPNQPPVRAKRVVRRAQTKTRSHPYRAIAVETGAKLAVNVILSMVAVTALFQLVPYRSSQVGKIQELDAAVQSTQSRVQNVQTRFQNFFDPYQARENMQQLTDRIDPMRRKVIWKAPTATAPANTEVPIAPASPAEDNGQ